MGTMGAMGMAEAVNDGLASLYTALHWHLTSNHYPPLPSEWVDAAIEAIEAGNDEDWDREITLPAAGRYAEQSYPAGEIIERMHLDAFLTGPDYDDEVLS